MNKYPLHIMSDIVWDFAAPIFSSRSIFEIELAEYNKEIKGYFRTNLDEKVLDIHQVVVQYSYWDNEEQDVSEPDFLLTADNELFFTNGELLYKVHNLVCSQLKDDDHRFFEGLILWEGESPNYPNLPLYLLLQGS